MTDKRRRRCSDLADTIVHGAEAVPVVVFLGANEIVQGVKGLYYRLRHIPYDVKDDEPPWRYVRRE